MSKDISQYVYACSQCYQLVPITDSMCQRYNSNDSRGTNKHDTTKQGFIPVVCVSTTAVATTRCHYWGLPPGGLHPGESAYGGGVCIQRIRLHGGLMPHGLHPGGSAQPRPPCGQIDLQTLLKTEPSLAVGNE